MNRSRRLGVVALGVAIAIAAFVAFRPGSDDEPTTERAATTQAPLPSASTPAQSEPSTTSPPPKPEPDYVRLKPNGEVRVKVKKGDIVRIAVRAPSDDEIHVHGYDLTKEAPAGRLVRMRFKAKLEGIFEIELEHSGVPVGELEVRP